MQGRERQDGRSERKIRGKEQNERQNNVKQKENKRAAFMCDRLTEHQTLVGRVMAPARILITRGCWKRAIINDLVFHLTHLERCVEAAGDSEAQVTSFEKGQQRQS